MAEYLNLDCIKQSQLLEDLDDTDCISDKFCKIKTKRRVCYDIIIENEVDFTNTLECLRFHMVNELPHEIYDFVKNNKRMCQKIIEDRFQDFFYKELISLTTHVIIAKSNIIYEAAKTGNINFINYLLSQNIEVTIGALQQSLKHKHNECFKLLFEIYETYPICGDDYKPRLYDYVGNNITMLKYLHQKGVRIKSYDPFIEHDVCLEYVYKNTKLALNNDSILDFFREHANSPYDILKHLQKFDPSRIVWNSQLYLMVAECCCVVTVKYIHEHGCKLEDRDVYDFCSLLINAKEPLKDSNGIGYDIKCFEYLHNDIGKRINHQVTSYAIQSGRLEIVKYLNEINAEFLSDACDLAVKHQHFEMLKCLHNNGHAITQSTIEMAMQVCNYEIFKYLHENLHECDIVKCKKNVRWTSDKILNYIRILDDSIYMKYSNKMIYIYPKNDKYISINSSKKNSFVSHMYDSEYTSLVRSVNTTYEFLIVEKNKHMIKQLDNYVDKSYYDEFKMIVDNIYDTKIISEKAIELNYPYLLKYLVEGEHELSNDLIYVAVKYKNYECLKYLIGGKEPRYTLDHKLSNIDDLVEKHNEHKRICNEAAQSGSYYVLKYICEYGFEYDKDIYYHGIISGSYNMIKYLRKLIHKLQINHQPCKINKERCLTLAKEHNSDDRVLWCINHHIKHFHE
jgi:hypothetical protein